MGGNQLTMVLTSTALAHGYSILVQLQVMDSSNNRTVLLSTEVITTTITTVVQILTLCHPLDSSTSNQTCKT